MKTKPTCFTAGRAARLRARLVLLCALVCTSLSMAARSAADYTLWYNRPAADWNHALPIGNGRLGAMVGGGIVQETIWLNEESLWGGTKVQADADAAAHIPEVQRLLLDGKPREAGALANKHMASKPLRIRSNQPVGELVFDMMHGAGAKNYRRALDLTTGMATVDYEADGVRYHREMFASADNDVMVLRLSASRPGALTMRIRMTRSQDAVTTAVNDSTLLMNGQVYDLPKAQCGPAGLHMRFAGMVRAGHRGGTLKAGTGTLYVQGADEVTLVITAATDYNFAKMDTDASIDPARRCADIIAATATSSYDVVKARHTAGHSAMMNRVTFHMGTAPDLPTDERLKRVREGGDDINLAVLYFQYGRYLLMNSSRKPGVLPANLQGLWNKDMAAAWNADFHTNINLQMNYWPAEVCNLPETADILSHFINGLRPSGEITASRTYGAKGWTMNHLTDPYGRTAISDAVAWGTFPIAGPWMALHQWEHYRFNPDRRYLAEEAYPSMRSAAEFLLTFMVKDKNGHLVTAPSNSPENSYRLPDGTTAQLTYGATMDIQIARELFQACLEAGKVLGGTADFDRQLRRALNELPPLRVSQRYGTIQEWIEDYEEIEPGHRHISHLFGLYPGTTITAADTTFFNAARRTIERRRYYNEVERRGSYTGWSRAWMINFYARLHDGKAAGENVRLLLAKTTQDNLFNVHPPFQIDGNFGGTAGIAEMLLQSHEGVLRLLPALPPTWADGNIDGLCARGGITVGMTWEKGKLKSYRLLSTTSQRVRVAYGGTTRTIRLTAGKPYEWKAE